MTSRGTAMVAAAALVLVLACSQSGGDLGDAGQSGEALEAVRLPIQPIPPVPTESSLQVDSADSTVRSQSIAPAVNPSKDPETPASIDVSLSQAPQPEPGEGETARRRGPDGTDAAQTVEGAASAAVIVTYAQRAFSPARIEIDVGQMIRFVNGSDGDMWPASNIHPTHRILPEFDAKRPIPPGESWVYTFAEPGFWRYHNHMDPSVAALVVVRGEREGAAKEPLAIDAREQEFRQLGAVSVQDTLALFNDDVLLVRFVGEYGPAATVGLLSDNAYRVGVDCHQRAHDMGRVAYELFGAQAFSLSGHECHSGGYHGATEAFFRDRGTATLAEDIGVVCAEQLNSFFRHQCVHGVGHGLMAWTSYELFDALELCDQMTTSADQGSCYSGVFMENVVGGLAGSMGHYTEYLSDDPHFPCTLLAERHMTSCYFFQTSRMVQLFNGDFEKVTQACSEAPESAHHLCFHSMGRDVGGVSRGRPDQAIQLCSFVAQAPNRIQCLDGAVQDSFWDAGGAQDALTFCGRLSDEAEARSCYTTIKSRAHSIYESPADLAAFCSSIPHTYRDGCP